MKNNYQEIIDKPIFEKGDRVGFTEKILRQLPQLPKTGIVAHNPQRNSFTAIILDGRNHVEYFSNKFLFLLDDRL